MNFSETTQNCVCIYIQFSEKRVCSFPQIFKGVYPQKG